MKLLIFLNGSSQYGFWASCVSSFCFINYYESVLHQRKKRGNFSRCIDNHHAVVFPSLVCHLLSPSGREGKCSKEIGGFGVVQAVRHRKMGTRYAMKTIPLSRVKTRESFDFVMKEVDLLKSLDHPNIVRLQV